MKIRKRLQFFCYLFSLLLILSSCSSGGSGSSDNTTIGSGDSGTKATKPNTVTVQPRAGGKGFTSDSGILPEVPLIGKDGGGKKLLAVYMVGSDLEGVNGFGTDD